MRHGPPKRFEALLRRAGRDTEVGAGAVDDLRREHGAWVAAHGPLGADLRYAHAAIALAIRLWLEGRRADPNGLATSHGRVDTLVRDVRFGLRALVRAPGFAVTSGVTFGVGVGATTAIFAIVHAVLLKPLPYPDAHELVSVEVNTGGEGWYGSSMPEFFDYEEQVVAFERVAAFTAGDVTMGDTLSPIRVRAVFASASLLPALGVEPLIGRFFTADEETTSNNRYVLLSHALWRQAYGGDPDLVGRTIPLFGVEYQVLGVMPPDFAFPDDEVRVWFPFGMNRASPNPRMNHFLNVIARLRDGEAVERAAAQLATYTARAREQYPEIYSERGFRARVRPLHERVVGDVRTPLIVLQGAVVLVLLIACVNVANLFLTRAESRRRELSVRAALGASRLRLLRQLTIESLLLAGAGGAIGIAFAWLAVRTLVALAPASIPRIADAGFGVMPLIVALLITGVAGLVFGTLPAFRATRQASDGSLARGGRGVVARRTNRRMRRGLVACQLALASIVAVGAGLMLRTLQNLRAVDTGFDPENVITLAISPAPARYGAPELRAAFWERTTARIARIPGVTAVGAMTSLPLSGLFSNLSIRVEGRVTTSIGDAPDAFIQRVTPGYFDALGVRLVRGRTFTAADRADAEPVVVVSESFARRFWPGEDPIGKTMRVFAENYPWLRVIGVVADIPLDRLDAEPQPTWYVPIAQGEFSYGTPLQLLVALRIDRPAEAVLPAVPEAVREIDPTAPVSRIRPMDQIVDASIAGRTFTFDLLRAFVLVALFLGCVGVYGVAALSVTERRGEIGLRKALGADRAAILGLIARESAWTVVLGATAGLATALAATRVMESLLFQVRRADAATLLITLGLLTATGLAASLLPAMRALRIEPVSTLREDS